MLSRPLMLINCIELHVGTRARAISLFLFKNSQWENCKFSVASLESLIQAAANFWTHVILTYKDMFGIKSSYLTFVGA